MTFYSTLNLRKLRIGELENSIFDVTNRAHVTYIAENRIVASTSPSRIEAHAGIFRSLMKGIFYPYVL